ncbi:MAG: hypothetical protein ACO3I1_04075 [Burkholderiales bacterium]
MQTREIEYIQDRLKATIKELEDEVSLLKRKLRSYRDYEKNRIVTEVVLILVSLFTGIFLGVSYVRG